MNALTKALRAAGFSLLHKLGVAVPLKPGDVKADYTKVILGPKQLARVVIAGEANTSKQLLYVGAPLEGPHRVTFDSDGHAVIEVANLSGYPVVGFVVSVTHII